MPKEITHLILRKHWIFYIFPIFWLCLFGGFIFLSFHFQGFFYQKIYLYIYWLFLGMILIFLLIFCFFSFLKKEFSLVYITNERIIYIHKSFFWKPKVTTVWFQDIKEIQSKVFGFFGNIFQFWNIIIFDTKNNQITLQKIWNPIESTRKINAIIQKNLQK